MTPHDVLMSRVIQLRKMLSDYNDEFAPTLGEEAEVLMAKLAVCVSKFAEDEEWEAIQQCCWKRGRMTLSEQLAQAHEQIMVLRKALCKLYNETKGMMSAHEIAVRMDFGNSNWNCLELAWSNAKEALIRIDAYLVEIGVK